MGMKIEDQRIIVYGCGKMGGALIRGWLASGLQEKNFCVVEPDPPDWLTDLSLCGLQLNSNRFAYPKICVIAVKPQQAEEVLSQLDKNTFKNTLIISLIAGLKFSDIESVIGDKMSVVRVMPNTPVSVNKGVSCLIQNKKTTNAQMKLAEQIFSLVVAFLALVVEP